MSIWRWILNLGFLSPFLSILLGAKVLFRIVVYLDLGNYQFNNLRHLQGRTVSPRLSFTQKFNNFTYNCNYLCVVQYNECTKIKYFIIYKSSQCFLPQSKNVLVRGTATLPKVLLCLCLQSPAHCTRFIEKQQWTILCLYCDRIYTLCLLFGQCEFVFFFLVALCYLNVHLCGVVNTYKWLWCLNVWLISSYMFYLFLNVFLFLKLN